MSRPARVCALAATILLATMPLAAAANQSATDRAREQRQQLLEGEEPDLGGPAVAQELFGGVLEFIRQTASAIGTTIEALFGTDRPADDRDDARAGP